jgi:hypothetical protein
MARAIPGQPESQFPLSRISMPPSRPSVRAGSPIESPRVPQPLKIQPPRRTIQEQPLWSRSLSQHSSRRFLALKNWLGVTRFESAVAASSGNEAVCASISGPRLFRIFIWFAPIDRDMGADCGQVASLCPNWPPSVFVEDYRRLLARDRSISSRPGNFLLRGGNNLCATQFGYARDC